MATNFDENPMKADRSLRLKDARGRTRLIFEGDLVPSDLRQAYDAEAKPAKTKAETAPEKHKAQLAPEDAKGAKPARRRRS